MRSLCCISDAGGTMPALWIRGLRGRRLSDRLFRGRSRLADDHGGLDVVELRPALVEIGLALLFDLFLVGAAALGRAFAIVAIQTVNHGHAVGDLSEGRKAHGVQTLVVAEIDEYLGGACVGTGGGERNVSAEIALGNGIIFQIRFRPDGRNGWVGAKSELGHEGRIIENAEEAGVVIEMMPYEIVEAVGTEWGPGARDGNCEIALGGGELHFVGGRGLGFEQRGMQQGGIVVRGGGCGALVGGRLGRARSRSLCWRLRGSQGRQCETCRQKHGCCFDHFLSSPLVPGCLGLNYFCGAERRAWLVRSTSAIRRKVFSPKILRTSSSE